MSRLENIQNSFKSIQAKTKAFFHGDRWKEVLVFFFFALLAFGFWLLQSLQQEYEIELVFPVKYKNVPVDIAFNVPEVETITAKVKDKGSVLLNYTFGRSFAPIEVNMKNTKEKNGSVQVSKRQIENDIQKQLIATTALQSFDPQQIDMDFSQRVHKEIPVVFNGDIHLEAGFQLSGDIHHDSDRGVHGEDIGNTCLLQSYTATLYGTYVSGGRKSDLQCALVPIQRTFGRYVLDSYTF